MVSNKTAVFNILSPIFHILRKHNYFCKSSVCSLKLIIVIYSRKKKALKFPKHLTPFFPNFICFYVSTFHQIWKTSANFLARFFSSFLCILHCFPCTLGIFGSFFSYLTYMKIFLPQQYVKNDRWLIKTFSPPAFLFFKIKKKT